MTTATQKKIMSKQMGLRDDHSMLELLDALKRAARCDYPEQILEKIEDPEGAGPGANVEVYWCGDNEGTIDKGYIFVLPVGLGQDIYESGIIHIPAPDNPGGKDTPPAVWGTLIDVAQCEDIRRIVISPRRKKVSLIT